MLPTLWIRLRRIARQRRRAKPVAIAIERLEERWLLSNWSGDIPDGTVWATGQVQRITADARIPAGSTLTIQQGAVVKFDAYYVDLTVDGTLLAQGTAGSPIVFTELRDDTGGDTNGDGGATLPSNGNWGRIEFTAGSTGSVLDHVDLRYGGFGVPGEVFVNGGQLTLSNSTVRNSSAAGVRIQTGNPTLTNNTYQNNSGAAVSMDLASNPAISGVTVTNNGINGLFLDTGTLVGNGTWNDPDIVYWFDNDITVPQGSTLTIAAGQKIKRPYYGDLFVNGSLIANGTGAAPIIFTERRDDTAGGDTNNDADGSGPSNGQSGVIQFSNTSTGNVMDHVEVRYAGYGYAAAVIDDGAPLTFTNGVIRNSGTYGLRIQSSNPTVTGNTIQNNSYGAMSMDLASNPAVSGNTLTTNGVNGLVLDTGTLVGNGAWNDPDIVYWMSNDITVPQGSTLTIAAGQVIKRPFFGDVFVNGSLVATGTATAPVIFTEQRDDDAGGDTNNGAGSPSNGNAGVIQFSNTSTGNVLDHVEVRYGGYGYAAAVIDDVAPLAFTNGVIRNSGTYGLRIQASNPTVTGNTFQDNSYGAMSVDLASNPAVSGNTLTTNGINGLVLDSGNLVGNGQWNDPDIVYWLTNDVTVPQGATLTIAPGQVIKRPYFGDLFVNGALVATGVAGAPIIITEQRDDTAGGDTNNDAAASGPGNGNAGVIQFSNTSAGNVMDHVEVRFGGYGYAAAVIDDGGPLAFTNGVVRNSSTNGLLAKTNAVLNVQNNLIVNNSDTGIRAESGATVTAVNNTIDGNFRGVAVDSRITVVTLTNNLITNNSRSGITATNQGSISVSFNDVLNPGAIDGNYNGLPNATGVSGNISVDPKYVDRAIRDFHLQATSPAIDAATSDNAPIDDFDFNFRTDNPATTNTGSGLSPFFEMGAYEFGGRPRAVKHSPSGDVADVVSKTTFTFRTAMDTSSFSPAADVVSFTGPAGPIVVSGFQWINRFQLEATFSPQATAGNYQVVIGPNILDSNGNALDTDGDGVRGESVDDRYSANWKIVPPRIVRQSLPNFVPAPVNHVDFTFDRPMDQQSFVPADDIVSFTGPGGNISATGFTWTDSRTLQVSFGSQTVLGLYEMVLGPNIRDIGGNLLDQSRNGLGGEVPVDRYTANFTLANIFFASGNITQNTTWGGLIIVDGNVTVQSGVTLTINPGTVIKFRDNLALTVATGATLSAIGTVAQPIRMTSIHDDTIGGDSEQDGDRIAPQPGDWSQIVNQGTANFDHVQILYSSGVGNTGLNSGAIRNAGGTVTFSNSAIIDAFYDGLDSVNGTVTITNSMIIGADRGVVSTFSADNITIINSTIFDNRLGVLAHAGGHITMKNSIIAESLQVGFDTDSGDQTVRYTDIFSSVAGATSYRGMTSQTGVNGNVSVNPKFIDAVQHNYRLDFASPVIDAAEGSVAPTTDHVGSPRYDDPRTANTGTPTANSAFADMGAFEFVEGAPSDLDLIVIGVSGPTVAMTGDIVTVQWTTKNVGTGIATGDWQDAVYLSADTVWSPDDVLLGQTLHSGNLGPGQSYSNSAEAKIPGILPSRYYFLVRANSDNAVFEGRNLTNNVAVASSGVTIDVAVLGIGTPVQGTLAAAGDAKVYKLLVPPGSNLKILLDGPNGAANELYLQHGAVPTRQSFDLRGILSNQPDQSVSLGTITGGTYYVLVFAASTPTSETFTLTASPTGFAIDSISPTRGGNTGRMTISIAGSQFDANSQPRLIDSASQTINPVSVAFTNSTLISATFDLTGRATGPATVEVVNTGNFVASLPDALNIVAGGQGRLVTTISAPDRVRLGRDFVAYVTYTNAGDTDLIAPIFRVINSGSSTLSLTKDRTVTASIIELIGVNPNGAPAGILPPGATGRIPIYGRAATTADQNLRVETAQFPSTPIDYAAIESAMRPAGLTDAQWAPLFNQLKTQIGTTWSGYVAALSRDATLLTPAQGLNYSVADVFQIEVDKARAALNSSVSGRLFLNDTMHPLSGPTILLVEQSTNRTFTTPASSDGTFLFPRIDQPGTYDVKVEGYILLSPVSVTAGTSDVTGVNLLVTPAATISGRVLLAVGGAPVADAAVMAYLAGGTSFVATTQGDGTYTIPNVPAGTYTVQAGESSYVRSMVSNILVGAGAKVQNVNLAIEVAGKISGKVNGPSGVLTGATVSVYGADGVPIGSGSVSSATGDYTIGGLPAGQFTVQASANGFAPAYLPNVSISAGVTLTNQNLTLSAGGSASGIVNSLASGTAVVAAVIVASKAGVDMAVTNSDTDGSFSLPNLAPGSYTFTAFLPGFASTTVNASVVANQTTNLGTLNMATSASVSGTVVRTSNSTGVGGLRVTAWTGGLAVGEAITDSNGGFAMNDLAFGTYLVTVGGEGQSIIASSSAILSSGTPAATSNFSLPIVGSITGTVFESNGVTPVTSAAVTLVSGATQLTSTITGADGRYQFYLTAPGTYGVQAVSTGAAFGSQNNLVIASGTDLTAINLVAGTAVVTGTIRNAATGQTVADGFLHISGTGINGIRTIVADTNGQYRFA
ncbi:MAG: carboxypeptidase regulatory-like domain-containing protein, partial [Planctomycetales bacterium]|nr:carboxypeptidase regulatory-like domain-containing protein [Planctomycetales bacterium]